MCLSVPLELPSRILSRTNRFVNGYRSFFAGNQGDLCEWFVKQEQDYEGPQTLFEFVASNYQPMQDTEERRKSSKTVVCEECGKSFSRLDSLRRHEKNYCKVKGDRVYCGYCGKKFLKSLSLISHVKSVHPAHLLNLEPQ